MNKYLNSIKDCTTVTCIETHINNNTALPGCQERYENEHDDIKKTAWHRKF